MFVTQYPTFPLGEFTEMSARISVLIERLSGSYIYPYLIVEREGWKTILHGAGGLRGTSTRRRWISGIFRSQRVIESVTVAVTDRGRRRRSHDGYVAGELHHFRARRGHTAK